ncbi:hypothetical protein KCP73_15830 [Salmonella enterica subsp. enterica]|nr:hypothetical protein KCP73_15830 [Salmonella enterica subsp. enterica]
METTATGRTKRHLTGVIGSTEVPVLRRVASAINAVHVTREHSCGLARTLQTHQVAFRALGWRRYEPKHAHHRAPRKEHHTQRIIHYQPQRRFRLDKETPMVWAKHTPTDFTKLASLSRAGNGDHHYAILRS